MILGQSAPVQPGLTNVESNTRHGIVLAASSTPGHFAPGRARGLTDRRTCASRRETKARSAQADPAAGGVDGMVLRTVWSPLTVPTELLTAVLTGAVLSGDESDEDF